MEKRDRGSWGELNSIHAYDDINDYVYEKYIAAPVQNVDTMVKIFLELAKTSMFKLSPIQKETLLKVYEYGMNSNNIVLFYSLEESLKYHLAEQIAYSFSNHLRFPPYSQQDKVLSNYRHIAEEIAGRYYNIRGRSGMLYNPSTLKPRGW